VRKLECFVGVSNRRTVVDTEAEEGDDKTSGELLGTLSRLSERDLQPVDEVTERVEVTRVGVSRVVFNLGEYFGELLAQVDRENHRVLLDQAEHVQELLLAAVCGVVEKSTQDLFKHFRLGVF